MAAEAYFKQAHQLELALADGDPEEDEDESDEGKKPIFDKDFYTR